MRTIKQLLTVKNGIRFTAAVASCGFWLLTGMVLLADQPLLAASTAMAAILWGALAAGE